MISQTFVYDEHRDADLFGWRPKAHPEFDPGDGMLVAHDLMEHFAHHAGDLVGELKALGAYWFVRIESGVLYDQYRGGRSREEVFAGVLSGALQDSFQAEGNYYLYAVPSPGYSRKLAVDRYDTADDSFVEAVGLACALLPGNMDVEDTDTIELLTSRQQKAAILGWVRMGYRAAYQRYRGDACFAGDLMRMVVNEVKSVTAANEDMLTVGDELQVSVSPKRGRVYANYRQQAYY